MEPKQNTYEGMFLLDATGADFEAASEPIRSILGRYGAEILACKPWEDRRLAFEIRGRKRGLYVLVYFKLDTSKVREIEHDCRLDERFLRALILRKDRLTQEQINADTPASGAPLKAIEAVPEKTDVAEATAVEGEAAIPDVPADPV